MSATPRSHRWKILAIGVAANASFSAAFAGIPTTAVLMRTGYALNNAQLGLILGLMGLGIALSELPWGILTDRWGDRPVLLCGLGATAAALLAMACYAAPSATYLPGLPRLGGGLLLVGLLGGSVNGSSGRAVMTWFVEGERGMAMSIRQTAVPLGGAVGALILPALAVHQGFAAMYGALALACAVSFMLAWCWLHEPPPGYAADHARATGGQATHSAHLAQAPLADRRQWAIVAAIGILCAPQFAVLSFGTVFLHDFGHASIAATTAAMVALQGGAMATRVWSGRWTDRHGNRRRYLRFCAALSALAFALLAGVVLSLAQLPARPSYAMPVLVTLLALCGICVSAWHGVAYTELATLAGSRHAGTALGMANTSVFAVCFVTPLAIPYLLACVSWPGVWLAGTGCALLAFQLFPRPASRNRLALGTQPR